MIGSETTIPQSFNKKVKLQNKNQLREKFKSENL